MVLLALYGYFPNFMMAEKYISKMHPEFATFL